VSAPVFVRDEQREQARQRRNEHQVERVREPRRHGVHEELDEQEQRRQPEGDRDREEHDLRAGRAADRKERGVLPQDVEHRLRKCQSREDGEMDAADDDVAPRPNAGRAR
jgi:hypothetical protein